MRVDGRCHCREITCRAAVDPQPVRVCHCTDCHVLGGTAFRASVPVGIADFTVLSGEPRCPAGGTPRYAADAHEPKTLALRIGAMRQRDALPPRRQIWYRSAQPWVRELDHIAHSDLD